MKFREILIEKICETHSMFLCWGLPLPPTGLRLSVHICTYYAPKFVMQLRMKEHHLHLSWVKSNLGLGFEWALSWVPLDARGLNIDFDLVFCLC